MISENNSRVIITLPKELKTWLEQQSSKDHRSLSNYIGVVLQKHKDTNKKDGDSSFPT